MAAFQAAEGVSTTPTRSFLSRENSRQISESSNGKTTASKPVNGGSIPLSGVVCLANVRLTALYLSGLTTYTMKVRDTKPEQTKRNLTIYIMPS